jgi:hypothetical protein
MHWNGRRVVVVAVIFDDSSSSIVLIIENIITHLFFEDYISPKFYEILQGEFYTEF